MHWSGARSEVFPIEMASTLCHAEGPTCKADFMGERQPVIRRRRCGDASHVGSAAAALAIAAIVVTALVGRECRSRKR